MQRVSVCLFVFLVLAFATGSTVHAVAVVAGSGAGTPTTTMHDFIPGLDGTGGWVVEAVPDMPIEVAADADAPPWEKIFSGFPAIGPGLGFSIHEFLIVAPGSPAWTDWHEDIVTPGWHWAAGGMVMVGGPTGTSYPLGGGGTPSVWAFFPPAPPGTVIEIWKDIVCGAPDGCAGSITILEHPTVPLPPAAWLLAPALLVTLRRLASGQS